MCTFFTISFGMKFKNEKYFCLVVSLAYKVNNFRVFLFKSRGKNTEILVISFEVERLTRNFFDLLTLISFNKFLQHVPAKATKQKQDFSLTNQLTTTSASHPPANGDKEFVDTEIVLETADSVMTLNSRMRLFAWR